MFRRKNYESLACWLTLRSDQWLFTNPSNVAPSKINDSHQCHHALVTASITVRSRVWPMDVPRSCHRSNFSTNFSLTCADLQIANSTSASNNYPAIICPPMSTSFNRNAVLSAVLAHVHLTEVYERLGASSTPQDIFKAIFKTQTHEEYIRGLLVESNTFPTLEDVHLPTIVCIRTEAEAETYGPNIWRTCSDTPSLIDLARSTLFLCPSWIQIPVDLQVRDRRTCPAVMGNIFVNNAQHYRFPTTRSFAITSFTLALYSLSNQICGWQWAWTPEVLNQILSNDGEKAAFGDNRSYFLFLFSKFHKL